MHSKLASSKRGARRPFRGAAVHQSSPQEVGMNGCKTAERKWVIRSSGRNRVRVPSSVLSRILPGETLSGLDESCNLAEGSLDGIQWCRTPNTQLGVRHAQLQINGRVLPARPRPYFWYGQYWCIISVCCMGCKLYAVRLTRATSHPNSWAPLSSRKEEHARN